MQKPSWFSTEEAAASFMKRNGWVWLKVPFFAYFAYLIWSFLLPGIWKLLGYLWAMLGCSFTIRCGVGPEVTEWHVWFMFLTQTAVLFLTLWYWIYIFAYLQGTQIIDKVVAVIGVVLYPVVLVVPVIVIGLIGELLLVPMESFWAYLDAHTPIQAWHILE